MKARDLLLAAIGMALYQIAASLDDRRKAVIEWHRLRRRLNVPIPTNEEMMARRKHGPWADMRE